MPLTSGDSLIGRDRELERLRGPVRAVRDGAAVLVLIEGEARIGKTRLLASLLDAAREQHVTVFHGRPTRSSTRGRSAVDRRARPATRLETRAAPRSADC